MYEQNSLSQLKGKAKTLLMGQYALPLGAVLVIGFIWGIITLILNMVFPVRLTSGLVLNCIAAFIVSLLMRVLYTGFVRLILNFCRREKAVLSDLLYGFSHEPDRIILIALSLELIFLGCMVPSIILFLLGFLYEIFLLQVLGVFALLIGLAFSVCLLLSYSLVYYVYLDHPEGTVKEILQESKRLMKGQKARYFYLQVSFAGLGILCLLSCGIGFLWLIPYMQTTNALFYLNLRGE